MSLVPTTTGAFWRDDCDLPVRVLSVPKWENTGAGTGFVMRSTLYWQRPKPQAGFFTQEKVTDDGHWQGPCQRGTVVAGRRPTRAENEAVERAGGQWVLACDGAARKLIEPYAMLVDTDDDPEHTAGWLWHALDREGFPLWVEVAFEGHRPAGEIIRTEGPGLPTASVRVRMQADCTDSAIPAWDLEP